MPRTPDQVLKEKTGDCDELARTYVAIAQQLGIKFSEFNMLEIAWKVKYGEAEETKTSLHACVVKVGKERFLIDPAIGIPPKPLEVTGNLKDNPQLITALNETYTKDDQGKPRRTVDRAEIVGVDEQQKYRLLEKPAQFASLYYYQQGIAYENQRKLEEAVKAYETAYKLDETNWRAKISFIEDSYDLGVRKLDERELGTNDEQTRRLLVEARKVFEKVVVLKPEHAKAHNELGTIFFEFGDKASIRKALNKFELALKYNENLTQAYHNKGLCHKALGDYQQAEMAFKEVIRRQPNDVDSRVELSHVYILSKNYDKAIETCEAILTLEQGNTTAYCNLGSAYNSKGLLAFDKKDFVFAEQYFAKAIQAYERALDSHSPVEINAKIKENLGIARENLRKAKSAQNTSQ